MRLSGQFVEEDPKEHGVRALLNFGHTLGHSIEKLMNFFSCTWRMCRSRFLTAADISCQRGYISEEENKEIKELYAYFDFPALPEELQAEDIVKETRHDKKMEHGKIKFILLDKVGEAAIYQDVTPEEMLMVLERV